MLERSDRTQYICVADLGHGFRLVCSGEIDNSNVVELRSAIDLCLGYRPLFLQIDFRKVTFVAWAAEEAWVYAKGPLPRPGGSMVYRRAVCATSVAFGRVFEPRSARVAGTGRREGLPGREDSVMVVLLEHEASS